MGVRSVHEALGIYTHDVHRRWGSVFWRSWARVIRGRLPIVGRPNADILHHGPPPAYAHGREAVGGTERGVAAGAPRRPRPASCAGHARRQACERRAAGWRVPAGPCPLNLEWPLIRCLHNDCSRCCLLIFFFCLHKSSVARWLTARPHPPCTCTPSQWPPSQWSWRTREPHGARPRTSPRQRPHARPRQRQTWSRRSPRVRTTE